MDVWFCRDAGTISREAYARCKIPIRPVRALKPEPFGFGNNIVIEEGDQICIALADAAVACPAQSAHWFDGVSGSIFLGNLKNLFAPFGVVDDKNNAGRRVESADGGEAPLQKSWMVAGADNNCGEAIFLLGVGCCLVPNEGSEWSIQIYGPRIPDDVLFGLCGYRNTKIPYIAVHKQSGESGCRVLEAISSTFGA
jgi:hypothetical protein